MCYKTQVKLKQIFPYKYWATLLTCSWRLGWNLQLLTIVYSGALGTAATFCLLTWAISIKGATYLLMFNLLGLIFVSLSEVVILGVAITAGMLIGMILIILGLYSFLWGKKKENKSLVHDENLEGEEKSTTHQIQTLPTTSPPITTPKQ
ncbi:hypothetical protein G4B88_029909 [Cannabis sativa]|uniref:WAT1-related protein n=1 Tax=Cannabis sativa TaxID=3483 RepID=A0A7J6DMV3_CANSA|nr:hypothetical protein G4B88_029909 [Cannabis sativa]